MRLGRLLTALAALLLGAATVFAQTPAPRAATSAKPPAATPTAGEGPTWSQLTPMQQEALGPLKDEWTSLDGTRKRKWLEMSARYSSLSPEGKQRFHERMVPYARMTPEQRNVARENFKRAYTLPADQRNSAVQHYQELPPESRQELANKAAAKKAEQAAKDAPQRKTRPVGEAQPAKK
jgi:Protein of unknown function (DUF3106)